MRAACTLQSHCTHQTGFVRFLVISEWTSLHIERLQFLIRIGFSIWRRKLIHYTFCISTHSALLIGSQKLLLFFLIKEKSNRELISRNGCD